MKRRRTRPFTDQLVSVDTQRLAGLARVTQRRLQRVPRDLPGRAKPAGLGAPRTATDSSPERSPVPAWPCAWTDVWAREVAPDGHSAAPPAPARSRTHPHSPALTHTHLHAWMTVRTDCRLTGPVSGMFYAILSPTCIFFSFLSRRQLTSGSGGRKRQACSSADKLAADLPAAPVPAFPTGPRTRRVLRGQGPPRSGRQHTPPLLTEAEPRARFLCATPGRGAGQDAFAQRPWFPLRLWSKPSLSVRSL